jgi:hypothetical protein
MLQIQQLNSTKCITCEIQKIIHGGQRPHSLWNHDHEKTPSPHTLWSGYENGAYNIKPNGDDITFSSPSSDYSLSSGGDVNKISKNSNDDN